MSEPLVSSHREGTALVASILAPELREQAVVDQVKSELRAAIVAAGAPHVVLDLSRVTFISSVGFLVFLSARRIDGVERIVLASMSPAVQDLFRVCQLLKTDQKTNAPFEAAPDVAAAVATCA
jgi:anti-anti-sigma factor